MAKRARASLFPPPANKLKMEDEGSNSAMILLTSSNYFVWKKRMEDYLYCKNLYDPVNGAKPTDMSDKDWKTLSRKTVAHIRQWIDMSLFHLVADETDAHKLWTKLESIFEKTSPKNKLFLFRKLMNLKPKRGSLSLYSHMSAFRKVVGELADAKLVLNDEVQALILLSSMPSSMEEKVASICDADKEEVLSVLKVERKLYEIT